MSVLVKTTLLLAASNVFMTFAWYAHLNNLNDRKWYIAAIASWGIALFEYLLQVPANRIGYTQLSLAQLKITQEVITPYGVCTVCGVLYARADQARLSMGGPMLVRCRLLHLSVLMRLILLCAEKSLRIDGCHTTGAGGGNGLAVNMILHIAARDRKSVV